VVPTPRRVSPDRDIVQEVIDGKLPDPSPPPKPERDPNPLGLVLVTGRLLASGGREIQGAGVTPDIQPTCSTGDRPRSEEDCLLRFAEDLVVRARDPQRSTLLSTAKEVASAVVPNAHIAR
jgi:hypothetical protein